MSCSMPECSNSSRFKPECISFHTFPRQYNELLQKLLNILCMNISTWTWSKNKIICSKHFKGDDVITIGGKNILKGAAISYTVLISETSEPQLNSNEDISHGISLKSSEVDASLEECKPRILKRKPSGTFKRSGGVVCAIMKQLKQVNLKPVKRIQVQFDPFHPNAVTARDFLCYISTSKVTETNLNCSIKTNIVCDRSEPEIKIDLVDSGSVKFLANNLTVLEILQHINKHISSKVKAEPVAQTKAANKLVGKRKK